MQKLDLKINLKIIHKCIIRFLVASYLRKREKLPKVLASLAFGVNKILFRKLNEEKLEDKEKSEHELKVSALNCLAFFVLFLIILICNLTIWLIITT